MNTPIKGMTVAHEEGVYWIYDEQGYAICDVGDKALAHQFAASGEVLEAADALGARIMRDALTSDCLSIFESREFEALRAALALAKGEST